jgi:hypothetical protein
MGGTRLCFDRSKKPTLFLVARVPSLTKTSTDVTLMELPYTVKSNPNCARRVSEQKKVSRSEQKKVGKSHECGAREQVIALSVKVKLLVNHRLRQHTRQKQQQAGSHHHFQCESKSPTTYSGSVTRPTSYEFGAIDDNCP